VPLIVRPPGGLTPAVGLVAERPGIAGVSARPAGRDTALDLTPVSDAPRAARVVEGAVSTVDLAATIADYVGIAPWGEGRSLRPAIEGATLEPRPVFTETFFPRFHYGWSELLAVEQGGRRLRVGPVLTAFDLDRDPAEVAGDPVDEDPLLATALALAGAGTPQPGPVETDALERLAALGYIAPVGPVLAPREALADPGERVAVLAELSALETLADPAEAIAGLRALLAREPDLYEARLSLGRFLRASGQPDAALEATLAVLERQPTHTMALSNAALLCRELGRHEQGVALARRMQAINPKDPRGFRAELVQWVDAERPDEVIRVAEAGLGVAPTDPQILYLYGLALAFSGRDDEAVAALGRAREAGSRATDIPLYLGMAHEHAGRVEEALAAYRAYSGAHPGDLRGDASAAWMLYKAGDCPRAAPFLINLVKRGHGQDARVREAHEACVGR
jgi:tetratricopeptide (TPR) repeat protein